MKKFLTILAFFLVVGLSFSQEAEEQISNEMWSTLRFNIQTPGARANAMGGSFIGLADDATAAFSNPAGLSFVEGFSFSVQYSDTNQTMPYLSDTDPSTGYYTGIYNGLDINSSDLTFASFSFKMTDKIKVGFVYNLAMDNNSEGYYSMDLYTNGYGPSLPNNYVYYWSRYKFENKIERYGMAVSYDITDEIAFGLTVFQNKSTMNSSTERFHQPYDSNGSIGFGWSYDEYLIDEDNAISFNGGFLIRLSDETTLGIAWVTGPKFEWSVDQEYWLNPDVFGNDGGFYSLGAKKVTVKLPGYLGVGISHQVTDNLLLAADFKYVKYNNLTKYADDYNADRKIEGTFGLEYSSKLFGNPIMYRAGYYVNYVNSIYSNSNEISEKLLLPHTTKLDHFTFGFGYKLFKRLDLDFSYDFASSNDDVSDYDSMIVGLTYNF